MEHRYVGLPPTNKGKSKKTYLYKADRKKKVHQVLWGDWLNVDGEEADGWLRVIRGPKGPSLETLFIPKEHTTDQRPLEIIFLDVGQGDGAVLITPERDADERIFVIDAGINENMHAFLSKRFKTYKQNFQFHAAIITHPDEDHYGGFHSIFSTPGIGFNVVYHNGLVEEPFRGQFEKMGGLHKDPTNGKNYVKNLAIGKDEIKARFGDGIDAGKFEFPKLMKAALANTNIKDFAMVSTEHGTKEEGRTWLPDFAPSNNRGYKIEIVGPVAEFDAAGKPQLRKIGSYGETKNGHSVLLRLHFGDFKILFGGDLNEKAEKFLLNHYTNRTRFPQKGTDAYKDMVKEASNIFGSDIMKVCHHGSEKVTDAFIETVKPAAFVISSGDEEGHVHPRPDLLGRLGKLGKGDTPVILSTELQRSTRDLEDEKLVRSLMDQAIKLHDGPTTKRLEKITDDIWTLGRSNVSVYGSIYLKADGKRLLTAFRIETGSQVKKWFTFEYLRQDDGTFELVS